ncbi:MAG TPA: type II toxin-antitoxin system VapC family toxin [Homoserinimonas sp.]|nr:type II toxin-antitoxin system VapC family toxin [Homoserinimonas sp.]
MIAYFDTSAFVPLIVEEASSAACGDLWRAADEIVSTRLLYVETSAALARAFRSRRFDDRALAEAQERQIRLWASVSVVELDHALMIRASELAQVCGLRGYDSVHCAAAELLGGTGFVAATGDRQLLTAWHGLGVATFPVGG